MYTILQQQYQLVLSARGALFDYCQAVGTVDLLKPMPAFNNECVISQLVHTANCYLFWLACTAMKQQTTFFISKEIQDINTVREIYKKVDRVMDEFLEHFRGSLDEPRPLLRPDGSGLTRSPFELFTHVITHEFHHKGQVVNMSRQLGNTPVDTDVIRE
ncbi:MAG TPA: DinB family protein [Mucilaginibacter sp.]|nr:DinB family protein [Mucilaginibacter sp.]